MKEILVWKK